MEAGVITCVGDRVLYAVSTSAMIVSKSAMTVSMSAMTVVWSAMTVG